jgi:hypothetical protein
MSKQRAARTNTAEADVFPYSGPPWTCEHYPDRSEIKAMHQTAGPAVLIIPQTATNNAREISEMLVSVANERIAYIGLIQQMKAALAICLENNGINWEAEHDADICMRRAEELGF